MALWPLMCGSSRGSYLFTQMFALCCCKPSLLLIQFTCLRTRKFFIKRIQLFKFPIFKTKLVTELQSLNVFFENCAHQTHKNDMIDIFAFLSFQNAHKSLVLLCCILHLCALLAVLEFNQVDIPIRRWQRLNRGMFTQPVGRS